MHPQAVALAKEILKGLWTEQGQPEGLINWAPEERTTASASRGTGAARRAMVLPVVDDQQMQPGLRE